MTKELITIPLDEYNELYRQAQKLQALENHGVDNWEWYDDAMETLAE